MSVSFHDIHSLFGFFALLTVVSQIVSGVMLSFSLVPEPMIIPMVRDEEDLEDLYTDDFFWLHERGVDLIFIFSWIHLFRKIYLNIVDYEQESAWKSGIFVFLIFQVVVFMGLVLCCTHLSEITLTIAANIMHTFFFFKGKFYWWMFTDKQLNTDTIIRLAYGHYCAAFFMLYLAVLHGIDMHHDWKNEYVFDGLDTEMIWWEEALSSELSGTIDVLLIISFFCYIFFQEPEALSYEIFMWGDIGLITDVRFYGVAPHWYFRPFMAWLIVCPHHKTGIFGLLFFFIILFFQPTINGKNEQLNFLKKTLFFLKIKIKRNTFFKGFSHNIELNIFYQLIYFSFLMCALYTSSFLPYGKFYNRLGGNVGMLFAYLFVFTYVTFPFFKSSFLLENNLFFIFNSSKFLKVN